MLQTHDFHKSLELSKEYDNKPWLVDFYKNCFYNFESMSIITDIEKQRAGVDKVITLIGGRMVKIEEKFRETDYGDILLEYKSSKERDTPGWIEKDLACDYIAYIIIPSQKAYLLPYLSLRNGWIRYKKKILAYAKNEQKGFRFIESRNNGYTTLNVAIPLQAINKIITNSVSWG